jgi:hypothetical protein
MGSRTSELKCSQLRYGLKTRLIRIVGVRIIGIWITPIIGITPIPPPRVSIKTETGNEKTIMVETAMAMKVPKMTSTKTPRPTSMKASASVKLASSPTVTASAATSPKPPVSNSIGGQSE